MNFQNWLHSLGMGNTWNWSVLKLDWLVLELVSFRIGKILGWVDKVGQMMLTVQEMLKGTKGSLKLVYSTVLFMHYRSCCFDHQWPKHALSK